MNKEFISYEQALELKELGFDEPCFKYIYIGSLAINTDLYLEVEPSKARNYNNDILSISQPTFSQAFRWFREKHGLASQFAYFHVPKWTYSILEFTNVKMTPNQIVSEHSKERTYEEAELACLKKLIEIVKNKQLWHNKQQ